MRGLASLGTGLRGLSHVAASSCRNNIAELATKALAPPPPNFWRLHRAGSLRSAGSVLTSSSAFSTQAGCALAFSQQASASRVCADKFKRLQHPGWVRLGLFTARRPQRAPASPCVSSRPMQLHLFTARRLQRASASPPLAHARPATECSCANGRCSRAASPHAPQAVARAARA
eukprot:162026-Chlamydomonas_euryale.AAC.1